MDTLAKYVLLKDEKRGWLTSASHTNNIGLAFVYPRSIAQRLLQVWKNPKITIREAEETVPLLSTLPGKAAAEMARKLVEV